MSSLHGIETLAIAGLGLLGGSVALAARERGLARRIVAVTRRPADDAVEAGIVDEWTEDLAAAVRTAGLVILGTPVEVMKRQLAEVLSATGPETLVTDVGSTKDTLAQAASALGTAAGRYVPAHPMAGSHLTGWRHARGDLFEDSLVYLTPAEATDPEAVERVASFWEALGARLVYTSARRHDRLVALLSHVPHMAAAGLVDWLGASGEDPHFLGQLAGPGFRDTTRVAMGSTPMWREILAQNAANTSAGLRELAARLQAIAHSIDEGGPELEALLERASAARAAFEPPPQQD